MKSSRLITLIIMDGFGNPENPKVSAIQSDNTQNLQNFAFNYSNCLLHASEEEVGLPKDQAGTSEVGHLTIGAGRVCYQPLVRINKAIEDKSFFNNKILISAMQNAKKEGRALHLLGMPTEGGIHSHIDHLFALLDMAKQQDVKNVFIHIFADGRDVPTKSIKKDIKRIEDYIRNLGIGEIASVIGRVWALDRDKNYDRNKKAYDLLVNGVGTRFQNAIDGVDYEYSQNHTDEFLEPIIITKNKKPLATINNGDSVISYNFRADRERQLAYVFVENNNLDWVKKLNLFFVCMMEYDNTFKNCKVAFKNDKMKNILSEVLSKRKYKFVKIAETEKYAHLTFFFNNSRQTPFAGEDWVLINSKKCITYASTPQMSAEKITDKAIELIEKKLYNVVIINFANCDMVGHSGDIDATKIAVKTVDECVKKVADVVLKQNGIVLLTADHGNADCMILEDGTPCVSHTKALVPFFIIDNSGKDYKLRDDGNLSDIAPTLLKLLNEKIPPEMTGSPLF